MNKKFFKFDFVTENLDEQEANDLWNKINKFVETNNGFVTGIYIEKTIEQLLNESEKYADEYNQRDTTKAD